MVQVIIRCDYMKFYLWGEYQFRWILIVSIHLKIKLIGTITASWFLKRIYIILVIM